MTLNSRSSVLYLPRAGIKSVSIPGSIFWFLIISFTFHYSPRHCYHSSCLLYQVKKTVLFWWSGGFRASGHRPPSVFHPSLPWLDFLWNTVVRSHPPLSHCNNHQQSTIFISSTWTPYILRTLLFCFITILPFDSWWHESPCNIPAMPFSQLNRRCPV